MKTLRHFTQKEFPEPLEHADPILIKNLDKLRDKMRSEIYPSPVPGALARFDFGASDSEHYAVNRLSTAIDFFCNTDPFEAWVKIIRSKLFTRVGIYFDTFYNHKKWVMFHCDLKKQDLLWLREDGEYLYSSNPIFYHRLFKYFFLNRENLA